ncbi:MAG: chitobiase/beta-hexosaminidase C-terminal domain-containing protein [Saprospiraceae bacterium]|nr:chitobiase/beta-hexosaminidase C-terminal domain-containing protein [Saprospiraceae bacterium]MCF8250883.1 chitobiase/beta-hexosaminidase C-terminal domain-containing protein [Saprospiraceae bacterium]MCF8281139.1 chitobiase/beta-hexosaminidase C-terminal domain-containing protein [Bacteroidales bacterium]MCF8312716.1 chitobiase/beta-hexosaminidase C-terminal domain-containing protein [Saprospiraceae bacterium]MCF8441163.1 chitobiase/beta-hexosaminidase C-terminal domain-containing protein [
MLQVLGRLHILVLHLPIGFLILAFLMELTARRSAPALRPAVGFSLFLSMVSAVAAAALGYLLSLDGGYDEELLNWHKWLGFATTGLSVALYFFHKKKAESAFYLPLFIATTLVLAATGHYGGSLTHGADYLFGEEKSDATAVPIASLDSAQVFEQVVLPVLKTKCGNCHNPSKRKGGLVVMTKEDLLKGGKNGLAINPDQPDSSLLLSAVHLPLEAKKHMPPKGKTQLTDTEKQLLDWWLKAGAPFDKTVAAAAMPAALRSILLTKNQAASSPLDGLKLDPVSETTLKKLRSEGIQVFPLATGSPFLQVLFQGKKDVTAQQLGKLQSIGKNIVQLNLSSSNVDDAMLAAVKEMPHLNRLYLERTAITDKGIANLAGLQYLEYLNLYQTKVTDAGLAELQSLPKLRSLYLWQSGVSPDGVAKFASQKPDIFIDKGIENDSMFGEVALKAPRINASTELFADTVQVALEAGFAKVKIHFTTDGKAPDSTSAVYTEPILLSTSGELKAIAYLEGWMTSPVASKSFVKVGYQPASISLAKPPDPRYKGNGEKTLIDFQRGGDSFRSGKWFGWQGHNCVATLDLGKVTSVSQVTAGCFEDTGGWIFFPKGIRISTSMDGKSFKKVGEKTFPVADGPTKPGSKMFTESFASSQARYVKVEVLSVLKNPKWHPNKGEPCWIFVDEILVE